MSRPRWIYFLNMKKNASVMYANENIIRLVAIQILVIRSSLWQTNGNIHYCFCQLIFSSALLPIYHHRWQFRTRPLQEFLQLIPKPIFAALKKFAASLGFIFSAFVFLFFVFQRYESDYITGSVLIFCALLESAFSICPGCYVFDINEALLRRSKI